MLAEKGKPSGRVLCWVLKTTDNSIEHEEETRWQSAVQYAAKKGDPHSPMRSSSSNPITPSLPLQMSTAAPKNLSCPPALPETAKLRSPASQIVVVRFLGSRESGEGTLSRVFLLYPPSSGLFCLAAAVEAFETALACLAADPAAAEGGDTRWHAIRD
jgi:hypothetical protein